MDKKYDFIIKNPKWQRNTFFVLIILGTVALLAVFISWLIFRFDWGILVGVALICFIEYAFSGFGLGVWYREEFRFENGEFIYTKAFGKKQRANIVNVAKVKFDRVGVIPRVTFIGKDGKTLIRFGVDGSVFKNNHFIGALMHYDVPIVWR